MALALALNAWRLFRGPGLPDRILALDTLYINALALLVVLGLWLDTKVYFEVAMLIAPAGLRRHGGAVPIRAARGHRRMNALPLWAEIVLIAALLVVGAGFALVGSWGLAKFATSSSACTARARPPRWAWAACYRLGAGLRAAGRAAACTNC